MHLGHRGRSQRRLVEFAKQFGHRPAQRPLDGLPRLAAGKRRHPILEFDQLLGDVVRQQIAPRRQGLAKLDENGSQVLQCAANTTAARQSTIHSGRASLQAQLDQMAQRTGQLLDIDVFVQPVPQQDLPDMAQALERGGPDHGETEPAGA